MKQVTFLLLAVDHYTDSKDSVYGEKQSSLPYISQ